jgi:hypothetical protein
VGAVTGLTFRLSGNDGILIEEVRVVGHRGTHLTWIFAQNAGWLDGDSTDPTITDTSVLVASAAMPRVTLPFTQQYANPFTGGGFSTGSAERNTFSAVIGTLTGREKDAGTRAKAIEIVFFGTFALYGPVILNTETLGDTDARFDGQSAHQLQCRLAIVLPSFACFSVMYILHTCVSMCQSEFMTLKIPAAIGNLMAIKLYNTGTDAWQLRGLSVSLDPSSRLMWNYDKWLDGDGAGPFQPSADIFWTTEAAVLDATQVLTVVQLGGSVLQQTQSMHAVGVALHFKDGTSSQVSSNMLQVCAIHRTTTKLSALLVEFLALVRAFLQPRIMTDFRFAHQDVGVDSVEVKLQDDSEAHMASIHTNIGFGGVKQIEHRYGSTRIHIPCCSSSQT